MIVDSTIVVQSLLCTIIQKPHVISHRHLTEGTSASEVGLILQRSILNICLYWLLGFHWSGLQTNSMCFRKKASCVRRRYSEFVWLRHCLQQNALIMYVSSPFHIFMLPFQVFWCVAVVSSWAFWYILANEVLSCEPLRGRALVVKVCFPRSSANARVVLSRELPKLPPWNPFFSMSNKEQVTQRMKGLQQFLES